MVVDVPPLIRLEIVHIGSHQDVIEGLDKVEEEPNINHLDVGGLGQVVADIDEHGGEDQHGCHIDRDDGFEEELLEVVGCMADKIKDDSGCKNSQNDAEKTATKENINIDYFPTISQIVFTEDSFLDEVLGQLKWSRVLEITNQQIDKVLSASLQNKRH